MKIRRSILLNYLAIAVIVPTLTGCYVSTTSSGIVQGGDIYQGRAVEKDAVYRKGNRSYVKVSDVRQYQYHAPYAISCWVSVNHCLGEKYELIRGQQPGPCYYVPVPDKKEQASSFSVGSQVGRDWIREEHFNRFTKVPESVHVHSVMDKLGEGRKWWRYPVAVLDAVVVDIPLSIVGTVLHIPLAATGVLKPDDPMGPEPDFHDVK